MLDFSTIVDLPMVWATLIGVGIIAYVLLDGFDLGVGIMFPFAPSEKCRDRMMNSVVPFWDGNETWLVLGGGGLLAAFPLAYSILLPAFYIPLIFMLLGLVLRGVAFEFRFKSHKSKKLWDVVFHVGSLAAAFSQGVVLGAFVDGVEVSNRAFSGTPFDWATGFSMFTGIALVFGYMLLGSTWLIFKTEDQTQEWAKRVASYSIVMVMFMISVVAVRMLLVSADIRDLWFEKPHVYYMALIPVVCAALVFLVLSDLRNGGPEHRPFLCVLGIFLCCYVSLAVSLFPWLVPFKIDIWEAAAYGPSLSLMLVGALPLLPIILGYTGYVYYIFRGKSSHEKMY